MCSTREAASLKLKDMRAKFLTTICVLAVGLSAAAARSATDNADPVEVATDALVVRPVCLVATVVGSAVFVVALPWAAASKNIKKTAKALVGKPASATFTRPMGDMEALKDY
jgi:hypothetical protein